MRATTFLSLNRRLLIMGFAFGAGAFASLVSAQSCQLPMNLHAPDVKAVDTSSPNIPTDFYSLALSWSPHHCSEKSKTPADRAKHAFQCRDNSFEFIVHGLWPQSNSGRGKTGQPRHCKPSGSLPVDLIRRHLCTVPGADLMQNEWQAHGTCAWNTPEDYFDRIETEFSRFKYPAYTDFVDAAGGTTVGKLKSLITQINPNLLSNDAVAVFVGKKNQLQEIWICLDKLFQPQSCRGAGTPDPQRINVIAPSKRPNAELFALARGEGAAVSRTTLRAINDTFRESTDSQDLKCPKPQRRFGGYGSGVKNAFWNQLYVEGSTTIYCNASFNGRKTVGGLDVNIEHVVPQSRISTSAGKGDLHNLWPSIMWVNSKRGNFALVDNIPGEFHMFANHENPELANCDFEVESVRLASGAKVTVVEPTESARGPLGRASLFMALAYPGARISAEERMTFLKWHKNYPVTAEELRRNDAIGLLQDTRNPFVDFPEHADNLLQICTR
jgi:ribonuclease T2